MQKSLLALAVLVASSMPMAAQASFKFNGVSSNGVQFNGLKWNGVGMNGTTLNGWSLNGMKLNGLKWNGVTLNTLKWNGLTFNGLKWNGAPPDGTGAWRTASIEATAESDWSAIAADQVRVRLPLAR